MKWIAAFGTLATISALLDITDAVPPELALANIVLCWIATAGFTLALLSWLIRGR